MTDVALGIDLGTGSTKAGLVDADGRLVDVARSPHAVREPLPGRSESRPEDWLSSVRIAVNQVVGRNDVSVVAVGMSGQMHGVIACDGERAPLRPAVLWSDRRAQPDLADLRDELADELPRLANPLVAGMAGPTVAALRRSEPEVAARLRLLLQPKDWVRLQLTDVVATDPSDASATLLWDVLADDWSPAACRVFGVRRDWLPEVVASDEQAGRLSQGAARTMGLQAGLPVAVGAADTAAALLGAGVRRGETQVSTGTGGQIARLLDRPMVDPRLRTHVFRAADAGAWYAMAAVQNAGIAVDWALDVLGLDLQEAAQAMEASVPGARGAVFVPYLTGERTPHMDAALTGQWAGLHPGVRRQDLVRAVFEGVAFALRDGLDALRSAGHAIDGALLAGGGSTAPWWRQLLADVLELALVPHDATDASVRGAGLLAWRSLGAAVDPAAAVHHGPPVTPERSYAEALDRYRNAAASSPRRESPHRHDRKLEQ